jgi:hypothetical protein
MIFNILFNFGINFFKYSALYIYFFLAGRSLLLIINKLLLDNKKIPTQVLNLNSQIISPIIGILFSANILVIIHFFIELKNIWTFIILGFLLLPNLYDYDLKVFSNIKLVNLFYYVVIPGILIISVSDITFNYDAGYYHLLHQNWLRESNLIFGMVNIFWPFGMSSIYEYLSSVLWFDKSFVLLHFLNIIFIHFFYLFISENIFFPKFKHVRIISYLILIYSLIDNFGIQGGRNGFLFIQGVTKQDTSVAVLVVFVSLSIFNNLKIKKTVKLDMIILSLLILFLFQIKVSSVIVIYLYLIFLYILIKEKDFTISSVAFLHLPAIFFGLISIIKSYITTGCLIFPLNSTCKNTFDWYIEGSTISYEGITKYASLAFNNENNFIDWIQEVGNFEYNRTVLINFVFSLIFIVVLSKIFLKKDNPTKSFNYTVFSYIFFYILYLIYFGPIPRYYMGLAITIIGLVGYFFDGSKVSLSKILNYGLIFASVFLIVRLSSYTAFISNEDLRLFDPRESKEINLDIGFKEINENWVIPAEGDQCWANLECSMAKANIVLVKDGHFQVAYK